MRIIIVRHGDPDYEHDSLTERGRMEAALVAERISKLKVDYFYQSPLGRAQATAKYTLDKMGRTATTYDWLREFEGTSFRPDIGHETLGWDWLPQDWCIHEEFYDKNRWAEPEKMAMGTAKEKYDWVVGEFDKLVAKHGYVREGNYYRVVNSNMDTIVIFCHFGVECVMLSRILGVSPMTLWQGTIAAPTSVTTIVTEERREGIASLRVTAFGDTSHLYIQGVEPAFAGRFCECFTNFDERHD